MICPRCKKEIDDDAQFCSHCGMKINRCPSCQQPIFDNAKYCSHCGKPIYSHNYNDKIEGYYQPIDHTQVFQKEKSKVSFQDIPTQKKINIPVIVLSVLTLVILTIWGYGYLDKTKGVNIFKAEDNSQNNQKNNAQDDQIMKITGTTPEVSMRGNLNQGGNIAFYKDKIYMNSDEGQLVCMDNQLQNQQVIVDGSAEYINIVNDVIYYTNESNQLCSVNIDGKDQKTILNKKVFYVVVKDNKVYYQFDTDQERIYVYDLKTNKDERLNERHSYNLNVIDDKIYYTSSDGIYCIGVDGQNDQKLVDGKSSYMVYNNQKLYYGTSDLNICVYDIQKKKVEIINQEEGQFMNMNEQYIFYSLNGLLRYDIKTKEVKRVYNGFVRTCEIVGDKVIITTNGYDSAHRVMMDFDGVKQQRIFQNQNDSYI